jgi:ribosomal protein S18
LWNLQQAVQKSERDLKAHPLENLYQKLNDFRQASMRALFYKDLETIERFIEEVLRTQSKNDIVPILHRFGAYLETLFGQVNMRTVLANHPFDYPKE